MKSKNVAHFYGFLIKPKLQWAQKTAAKMQADFLPLINALFSEVNPIPAKAAVSAMGFGEENLRMPLTPMEDATRAVLYAEMRKLGINV